jgi:micrococcal nuclease
MISRWRGWWLALLLTLLPALVSSQGDSAIVQVVRVIDGDTIQVCCIFGDREKVRYIGINTPETKHPTKGVEHYGKEASEANRKLVDGKPVSLEFDVEQRDRYGRLLAYVFLKDGIFVNAWLVENGYAQVMTVPANVKYQDLFLKLQREAREAGRGLWR